MLPLKPIRMDLAYKLSRISRTCVVLLSLSPMDGLQSGRMRHFDALLNVIVAFDHSHGIRQWIRSPYCRNYFSGSLSWYDSNKAGLHRRHDV